MIPPCLSTLFPLPPRNAFLPPPPLGDPLWETFPDWALRWVLGWGASISFRTVFPILIEPCVDTLSVLIRL